MSSSRAEGGSVRCRRVLGMDGVRYRRVLQV